MKALKLPAARTFRVLAGTARSQAAEMVIPPGESEGGGDNRHRRSDQWLLVTEGTGIARIAARKVALRRGVLLLIEKNEPHEIRCTGRRPLRSLNIYAPPAY